MAQINNSILTLHKVGEVLADINQQEIKDLILKAKGANPYFTVENCIKSIDNIVSNYLNESKLNNWIEKYSKNYSPSDIVVGIIAAGNIPFVSMHDVIACLVAGTKIKIKLSAKDQVFMQYFIELLLKIDSSLADRIEIVERLKDFDAVIATGSDNTSRYFDYYFKKYPHIIRGNRISIAVLDGKETDKELQLLTEDIFSYFGLGCRNISQIVIPQEYDFRPLIKIINNYWSDLNNHHYYRSNLDYYRTIFLMNKTAIIDCDFVNMVENESPLSSISTLHYLKYQNIEECQNHLKKYESKIQCIAANENLKIENSVSFGETQSPTLNEYADNVDTLAFLLNLKTQNLE